MADESSESRQPANKPGTSCLGCRRRKLKCSREPEGCHNCTKSDLPCVYPTPEVGVKRKRGPYKKDKHPRQRHLEDLVKYLEPKDSSPDTNGRANSSNLSDTLSPEHNHTAVGTTTVVANGRSASHLAASEDLVKDALIALTRSSVTEQETTRRDDGAFLAQPASTGSYNSAISSHHPSIRRIFEYWQIFTTRVDPMTKIFHCPTLGKKLFSIIDNLQNISPSTEAMLFSIYYSAVSTCTAREAQKRFGESQDVLLKRYGRAIEAALGDNYEMPTLESLQALVLYIVCIRRQSDDTNVRALYQLAVRCAQMIGMHEDSPGKYSVYETQIRRRVWFHLYGLENKTAEEGIARGISIMANSTVELPANLNDIDLDPDMTEAPKPRHGVTDMTFILVRFEIHRLVFKLYTARKMWTSGHWKSTTGSHDVRDEQQHIFDETKSRIEAEYSAYCDASRPYDYMCLGFLEAMMIKARLLIDFPFGRTPTNSMPVEERMTLLGASVKIIKLTHQIAIDARCPDWLWYFRGYVQWHSLAIIVAELGWSTNRAFTNTAWSVLDPILTDWDAMYKVKREEPAWDHVNSMIQRARNLRRQRQLEEKERARDPDRPHQACGSPINANAVLPFNEEVGEWPEYTGSSNMETLPANLASSPQPIDGNAMSTNNFLPDDISTANMTGLEGVDFDAFDHVFGTASWEFMDPFDDINAQVEIVQQCDQHMGHEHP